MSNLKLFSKLSIVYTHKYKTHIHTCGSRSERVSIKMITMSTSENVIEL